MARMATLPDLDGALRGVAAEKLDEQCSRDDLNEISKSLTRWPEVSPFMGLTEADEEEVRDGQTLKRQRVDVLRMWRKNRKESATYRWVVDGTGGGWGRRDLNDLSRKCWSRGLNSRNNVGGWLDLVFFPEPHGRVVWNH